ncbi:hypothetical protein PS15p_210358 [Mucor circinelloides]
MSLSYDFVVSEFRHYDYQSTFNNKQTDANTSSPPSYSAVLAEKYQQQCATWDKKLREMDHLLQSMKRSMKDTQFMLKSYQRCCQRLELKNQTLLLNLKNELSLLSDIDTTSFDFIATQSDQSYQEHNTNDSLNRMNQALQRLIREAEISLNTRLSSFDAPVVDQPPTSLRKSKSCPRLDKRLQQKKRYLYSQWKLATTMKQFIETVQNTTKEKKHESSIKENAVIHHHHHHIHHHYYHHHHHHHTYTDVVETTLSSSPSNSRQSPSTPPLASPPSTITGPPKMLRSASSLTSLFKYAIDTVGGFIPQSPPSSIATDMPQTKPIIKTTKTTTSSNLSKPTLHRAMFLSTILMMRKFNYSSLWIRRGNQVETYWKSRPRYDNLLRKEAQLLWYILQLFISKSTISSSTRISFVL